MENKYIYVVVSQTGTLLLRIIHRLTGAQFCHSSVSLDASLSTMYSFGRRFAYNPFVGGYVKESVLYGTFKRFSKTEIVVLRLFIEENCYVGLREHLEEMYHNRKEYGYNYIGLLMAGFRKEDKRKNRFYCSEFVRDILLKFRIRLNSMVPEVARPMDFVSVFADKAIYSVSCGIIAKDKA